MRKFHHFTRSEKRSVKPRKVRSSQSCCCPEESSWESVESRGCCFVCAPTPVGVVMAVAAAALFAPVGVWNPRGRIPRRVDRPRKLYDCWRRQKQKQPIMQLRALSLSPYKFHRQTPWEVVLVPHINAWIHQPNGSLWVDQREDQFINFHQERPTKRALNSSN